MSLELLGYSAAIVMGLSLGLMGGGGSILTVPMLAYLFGQDAVTATGLSLFIVGTTSAAGLFSHHRQGNIHWPTAAVFGASSMASVYAARHWLVPALPDPVWQGNGFTLSKDTTLLILFALAMLFSAVRMIRGKAPIPGAHPVKHGTLPLVAIGLGVGLLTGVLGAGGGFLIVPALVLLAGMDMKHAVGTSLLIITLNSFVGFMGDTSVQLADHTTILLPILALAILGIILGSRLATRTRNERLRPAFGWFILAMGAFIIVHELYTSAG
ncbi:MAG: sulfite exporter TauE/SafE family protein [Flavobacteriales bacterium]|nr:sulfite exporter TauE/SafE family protein [Flavobacteriales bacterium]MEB2342397.1 sulfite exporter TauE/SafE family protein [Flavobacteriia bacterium]